MTPRTWTQAQQAAQDPSTPPQELERLARTPALAPHIARNPNTPLETIAGMAGEYPDEALANPSFRLGVSVSPELVESMSVFTLRRLALRDDAPAPIVRAAQGSVARGSTVLLRRPDANARETIADLSLRTPISNTRRDILEANDHITMRSSNGGSPRFTKATMPPDTLVAHWCREAPPFTQNPQLIPRHIQRRVILEHRDANTDLTHLAKNPNLTHELALDLADHPNADTRRAALHHPNLTLPDLTSIAQRGTPHHTTMSTGAIMRIAKHPHATPTHLEGALARAADPRLTRDLVARNPNAPPALLKRLHATARAEHDIATPASLAANPHTPLETIGELLAHPNPGVRAALVENEDRLTPEQRDRLLHDPNTEVRERYLSRTCDEDVLERYARDESATTRAFVASNEHAPERLLAILANDQDGRVATQALVNPSLPERVLDERLTAHASSLPRLLKGRSISYGFGQRVLQQARDLLFSDTLGERTYAQQLLAALALNPDTHPSTRADAVLSDPNLYEEHANDLLRTLPRGTLATRIADHTDELGALALLAHTLRPNLLEGEAGLRLAHREEWSIRYVLACRDDLPSRLREVLLQDGSLSVREAARSGQRPRTCRPDAPSPREDTPYADPEVPS